MIIALLASLGTMAQEYVYANTENLLFRDRPEKTYRVFLILQPGCKLEIESMDRGYARNKEIVDKYYPVAIRYIDERGHTQYFGGYVMKKYCVKRLEEVAAKDVDTTMRLFENVPLYEYQEPEDFNCALYKYPTYKGGELQFAPSITPKVYFEGPRGGCYYLSKNGNRIYVDKKFCN